LEYIRLIVNHHYVLYMTYFDGLFLCVAAEITMFENNIVVYKFVQDLHFFVTGSDDENELILSSVLQAFFDSVGLLLRLFSDT
jgi:hypothetical protein